MTDPIGARLSTMAPLWALCRDLDIASNAATEDTVARHHTMTAPLAETRTSSDGREFRVHPLRFPDEPTGIIVAGQNLTNDGEPVRVIQVDRGRALIMRRDGGFAWCDHVELERR